MFILAIFLGVYSYLIFALGLMGILTKENIFWVTVISTLFFLLFELKALIKEFQKVYKFRFKFRKWYLKPVILFIALIVLQAFVNLIGALGPELGFDALWYHLTLPKLYLLRHSIFHIPGGLLYYSDMPKLGEMLYTGVLAFGNETTAKVIHFVFGLLILVALYKMAREFFNPFISFLVLMIFYANLVVGWESITAYIDLIRTFFETMALWSFLLWVKKQNLKWFFLSSLMVGFAITTKLLAIGSLFIFIILIFLAKISHKKSWGKTFILNILFFILISFLVPLPWFIFSFIHTGNPVYPFFTHTYGVSITSFSPLKFLFELWKLFTQASDPLSPMYLIFLPLLFFTFAKFKKEQKLIVWYSLLSIVIWYLTPRTGGGRFILPYLPAFSLVCGFIIDELCSANDELKTKLVKFLVGVILVVSMISIGYRGLANRKYIPIILGKESKGAFLSKNLNFNYGDFYDSDNYFKNHLSANDTVVLYGFHNLFYMDFNFIDSSWLPKKVKYNYIATQLRPLPSQYKNWQLVYQNSLTHVKLYRKGNK